MDDEALADIEREAERACEGDVKAMYDICAHTVPQLTDEIRRLRDLLLPMLGR